MLKLIRNAVKDSKDEVAKFGEIAIDLATDNEAWANVPLVTYAVGLLKIKDAYKVNKLKRNYAAFIGSIDTLGPKEQKQLLDRLRSEGEDQLSEDVAETIFDVIIEGHKPIKAKVLGNLLCALARGDISIEDYNTMALMIQACSVAALQALPKFLQGNNLKSHKSGMGAVPCEALLFSLGVGTRNGTMFRIDATGILMARHGFMVTVD